MRFCRAKTNWNSFSPNLFQSFNNIAMRIGRIITNLFTDNHSIDIKNYCLNHWKNYIKKLTVLIVRTIKYRSCKYKNKLLARTCKKLILRSKVPEIFACQTG